MHRFWRLEALFQVFRNTLTDGYDPGSGVQREMFDNLKELALERRMRSVGLRSSVICHVLRIPLVKITDTRSSLARRGSKSNERCGQIVGMVSPGRLPQRGAQHVAAKEVREVESKPGSTPGENAKGHSRAPLHLCCCARGHATPGGTNNGHVEAIGGQRPSSAFDSRVTVEGRDDQHHYSGRALRRHRLDANAVSPIAPQPQDVS